jgi:hypothetical protein
MWGIAVGFSSPWADMVRLLLETRVYPLLNRPDWVLTLQNYDIFFKIVFFLAHIKDITDY